MSLCDSQDPLFNANVMVPIDTEWASCVRGVLFAGWEPAL